MKIRVTKKDIMQGKRNSISMCPIALAVKRAYKAESIIVSDNYARLTFKTVKEKKIRLPAIARKFIKKVDNNLPIEPIEFCALKT